MVTIVSSETSLFSSLRRSIFLQRQVTIFMIIKIAIFAKPYTLLISIVKSPVISVKKKFLPQNFGPKSLSYGGVAYKQISFQSEHKELEISLLPSKEMIFLHTSGPHRIYTFCNSSKTEYFYTSEPSTISF